MDEQVVKDISTVLGKSPAQVLLRWALQKGFVIIPKSVKKERIVENYDIFDFALSEDQMTKINYLDRGDGGRFCHPVTNWLG